MLFMLKYLKFFFSLFNQFILMLTVTICIVTSTQPAETTRTKRESVTHLPRKHAPPAVEVTKFGEPVHHPDQHTQ